MTPPLLRALLASCFLVQAGIPVEVSRPSITPTSEESTSSWRVVAGNGPAGNQSPREPTGEACRSTLRLVSPQLPQLWKVRPVSEESWAMAAWGALRSRRSCSSSLGNTCTRMNRLMGVGRASRESLLDMAKYTPRTEHPRSSRWYHRRPEEQRRRTDSRTVFRRPCSS